MSQSETDLLLCALLRSNQYRDVQKGMRMLTKLARPIALQFIRKNSGSLADAEDILQDSLETLWLQIRDEVYIQQPGIPLASYAGKIIRNKWYKELRRRRTKNEESLSELEVADDEQEEETYLDQVEKSLNQLGGTCQIILQDYYINHLDLGEIAENLNKTYAAIKEQKYRCMLKLKAIIYRPTPPKNNKTNENK